MADAFTPQTPPKKLFKPSSKTLTPTRPRPSPQSAQSAQQTGSPRAPRSIASDTAEPSRDQTLDTIADSTKLAPLTNVSEGAGSDTTGETSGLVDNYVLTPADTVARSTSARSHSSRETPQNVEDVSSSFKDKLSRAGESTRDSANGVAGNVASKATDGTENITDALNSPADIAKYFRDKGIPEMGNFVASLAGNISPDSSKNTPRAVKSPAIEKENSDHRADESTSARVNDKQDRTDQRRGSQHGMDPYQPEPANLSQTADGTFRDTKDNESTFRPTNNTGEPNVSNISQAAQPGIPKKHDGEQMPESQSGNQDGDAHVIDNMGQPARLERRIEIPLQRPSKGATSPPDYEKQRRDSQDLGDFEDLPSTQNLASIDDLPDISEADSQDPPEEILDPSVHSKSSSSSITPIPKIPKIAPIDSSPPIDLPRLAKGLAGYVVDDVGNVVDESGNEVLGHVTGDLPAMVGKKVSDNGEVYGDGGELIGYVSDNFVNPPPPTEIPGDVLGRLRVDHKGNILDSDGNIIGKFNQPPARRGLSRKPSTSSDSPQTERKKETKEETKEEQKPKVNANTGGSPSDLFLDVKSTTDGIQLTIRIPTTFSRPASES